MPSPVNNDQGTARSRRARVTHVSVHKAGAGANRSDATGIGLLAFPASGRTGL